MIADVPAYLCDLLGRRRRKVVSGNRDVVRDRDGRDERGDILSIEQ